jgi:hypothetical protein
MEAAGVAEGGEVGPGGKVHVGEAATYAEVSPLLQTDLKGGGGRGEEG